MGFANAARNLIEEFKPDCIAVELPPALGGWIARGALRLPQISSVCWPSGGDLQSLNFIPIDPCDSMIEAARLALGRGVALEFMDGARSPDDEPDDANLPLLLPDDAVVAGTGAGLEAYVELAMPILRAMDSNPHESREQFMANRLRELAQQHERVVCVLGINHFERVKLALEQNNSDLTFAKDSAHDAPEFPGAFLAHLKRDAIRHFLHEIPVLVALRERHRAEPHMFAEHGFDKLEALADALNLIEKDFREKYKVELGLNRMKGMMQFARNLAWVRGRIEPTSYECVIGAKSLDGDYGYEVWKTLNDYDLQDNESGLPQLDLRRAGGRLFGSLDEGDRKYGMIHAFGEPPMESVKLNFRRRPTEIEKAAWKEQWDQDFNHGICSWPPEDERQEKFMAHLRKRALQVVSEDKKQVVEFTTSILDGLDIRETMRQWHEGKIFVQQTPQPRGKVGAVVLIFDSRGGEEKYPWRETLFAENQNESDIAFFATPPGATAEQNSAASFPYIPRGTFPTSGIIPASRRSKPTLKF